VGSRFAIETTAELDASGPFVLAGVLVPIEVLEKVMVEGVAKAER